jgi:hypothetical protein
MNTFLTYGLVACLALSSMTGITTKKVNATSTSASASTKTLTLTTERANVVTVSDAQEPVIDPAANVVAPTMTPVTAEEVTIALSDAHVMVNGKQAYTNPNAAVYLSNDIIYYEDKDAYESGNPYGEGTDADKHTAEEAAKHTVVNITKPGTYRISGKLSYGQIFVNVGKEETDKVTLILDGVDINCDVAPAVFFYKVYECDADATEETATNQVDTSDAGARVIIADGTTNNVSGSYVARIYKDNDQQKKLHKYDGAFYSRMSMEVDGGEKGDGILNIFADNEGLDTELHLTINGGNINISSGDDGINVNEDNISVFTMNGGSLNIFAGNGAEGDGIDSNGFIVINDGVVASFANPKSMDSGIDADKGIVINGGTVMGVGNMYDHLDADSKQGFAYFQFSESSEDLIVLTDTANRLMYACELPYNYGYIVLSTPDLTDGTYHLYKGGKLTETAQAGVYTYSGATQLQHGGQSQGGFGGPMGGGFDPASLATTLAGKEDMKVADVLAEFGDIPMQLPDEFKDMTVAEALQAFEERMNQERPQMPEGMTPPEGMEGMTPPEMPEGMEGMTPPEMPEGGMGGPGGHNLVGSTEEQSYDFVLSATSRGFTNVTSKTAEK